MPASSGGAYGEQVMSYKTAGWQGVLPVKGKILAVKAVSGKQGRWPTNEEYGEWVTKYRNHNIALRLPPWIIGVDIDAYEGKDGAETLEMWESRCGKLPPTWRSSAREDPISGIRYFKVPPDVQFPSELGPGIEIVQFHHRYGVVWPSKHVEIGSTYYWYNPVGERVTRIPTPQEITELPESWLEQLASHSVTTDSKDGVTTATSLLSQLLAEPPEATGGRNNWLTRVAGHIAKGQFHPDGFEQLILTINRSLTEPLGLEEVTKTARSIWQAEQVQRIDSENLPAQETGWLLSGADHLLCQVEAKDKSISLVQCSDFDIRAIGKYTDDRFNTFYKVQVISQLHTADRFLTEPAGMFGDSRGLRKRLQSMELNIWPVRGDSGSVEAVHPIQRLGHYLSSQEAPALQVVPCMGWNDEAQGFVCDEGVISTNQVDAKSRWVLDPAVRVRDPMQNKYGFEGSLEEAQKILREVLTFQDETVTSVFGAWWAACFIKAQLMQKVSGFPFMAIEATSGTGKTEGFFNLMVQLNGATRLGSHQTAAAFRDSMASNRSGIVWIDDLDNAVSTYQDIRCATNEASRSKKAADNTATSSVRLVAPVLLTGESLPGLNEQTALADRMIQLHVPPAKNRRSQHGDHEQWLDILDLREKAPDLWKYSGWFVQQALIHATDVIADWKNLRPSGMSRHGDKIGALRVGARLLDILCGEQKMEHTERVDNWVEELKPSAGDFMISRILPECLREHHIPRSARGWVPVWVDDEGIVWWHAGKLSDWWQSHRRGPFSERERNFGTMQALELHRQAMGVDRNDRKKYAVNSLGEKYSQQNYYPCPREQSDLIMSLV